MLINHTLNLSQTCLNSSYASDTIETSTVFRQIIENFNDKCWMVLDFWMQFIIISSRILAVSCLYIWYPALFVLWLMELEDPMFSKGYSIYSKIVFILFMFYVFLFEMACIETCIYPYI